MRTFCTICYKDVPVLETHTRTEELYVHEKGVAFELIPTRDGKNRTPNCKTPSQISKRNVKRKHKI